MKASVQPREDPKRLVKVWLPPETVTAMDSLIRSSGAYAGRDDFIFESVTDRIKEESMGREPMGVDKPRVIEPEAPDDGSSRWRLGLWEARAVKTAPSLKADGILTGLHNRDFPTLWAADLLASWVATRGEPASWMGYVGRASSAAWRYAHELADEDTQRPLSAMKAATGFPRTQNVGRRHSSEQRFVEHMIGTVRQGKPQGPVFVLGLAGVVDDETVAPTKSGLRLLEQLASTGIGPRPPHPREAWMVFRDHLSRQLPADLAHFTALISAIGDQPGPADLIGVFSSEWQGTIAQTNVSGYVSRAREWGLVEPRLIDDHYRLTEAGKAELKGRS